MTAPGLGHLTPAKAPQAERLIPTKFLNFLGLVSSIVNNSHAETPKPEPPNHPPS